MGVDVSLACCDGTPSDGCITPTHPIKWFTYRSNASSYKKNAFTFDDHASTLEGSFHPVSCSVHASTPLLWYAYRR